jgi:hypothetical protein
MIAKLAIERPRQAMEEKRKRVCVTDAPSTEEVADPVRGVVFAHARLQTEVVADDGTHNAAAATTHTTKN